MRINSSEDELAMPGLAASSSDEDLNDFCNRSVDDEASTSDDEFEFVACPSALARRKSL